MNKWVYLFKEGNAGMRNLLGGKGANLAEMTNLGLPVPQGFTITTEACTQYYEDGQTINEEIMGQIMEYIAKMEEITGKKFGDKENPLLVSVRSGARASMPGMMDTILNLGLNEDVVEVLSEKSGNPRWAWDCYRRFIQMYSDVVMEVGKKYFEELIDQMKEKKGVTQDVELTAEDLKILAGQFKDEYKKVIGEDFPVDPKDQLMGAIKAVFRSWDNPRANVYRRDNDIPYSWGTAVNVQMMAFGNMGDTSGTGVAFTRDPATGEKHLMGEFLLNAQGEDVVAGVRTPQKIGQLAEIMPEVYNQFLKICNILEDHYRDMQGSVLDPGQDSFQKNCALLQDVEKLLAQGLSETSASTPASDGRLRFHLLCGRLTPAKQDYIADLGCPVLTVPQDCTGQRLEAALASQLERLPQTGPGQEYVVSGSFCTRKERSAAVSALLKALQGKDARPLFACTFVLSPSKKSWLFHGKPVLQGTGLPHTVQCLELPSLLLEESLSSVRILSLPS